MKLFLLTVGVLCIGLNGAANAAEPWPAYQILEWQPRTPDQLATLKSLGITGAMAPINVNTGQFDPTARVPANLRAEGLSYYIENIATDFYAAYHRWTPGKKPGWRFAELRARYLADPSDNSVFFRDPSLSDPAWLARISDRLTAIALVAAQDHPLFYNLGDETGIAELAAPWDFDLSPVSIAGFRTWLQTQYPSIAALNQEWGTNYSTWSDATPELTNEVIRSKDTNFARWADFKAWMDVAFASALHAGTDTIHHADPDGRSAIEGAQVPGWGGYDYTLLARAVDVMEIYDGLENLAILRSLNPAVIPLTTAFNSGPRQRHAIWREFLRGARGLVLWDDKGRIVGLDGTPGPDAAGYKPVFAALRGKLGQAILDSRPMYDPIAILYSPASFRIEWMLEQLPEGQSWVTRSLDTDDQGNAQSQSLALYAQTLAHLGFTPHYVSPDALARDELHGARMLILPHAVALSSAERSSIAKFTAQGGTVIADIAPGGFDDHGKPASELRSAYFFAPGGRTELSAALARAGIQPRFPISATAEPVTIYSFESGKQTILAVQQDFSPTASALSVTVSLPHSMTAIDLGKNNVIGRVDRLSFTLDPITPAVFSLTDSP